MDCRVLIVDDQIVPRQLFESIIATDFLDLSVGIRCRQIIIVVQYIVILEVISIMFPYIIPIFIIRIDFCS